MTQQMLTRLLVAKENVRVISYAYARQAMSERLTNQDGQTDATSAIERAVLIQMCGY